MADDVLAAFTPPEVAAFYARLADAVDARKGSLKVSLAAMLMRMWLANRDKTAELSFDAPDHLRNHEQTKATLAYHRQVFLTEKKARVGSREVWAGVVPRIQGKAPHAKWDLKRSMPMEYESLTEFPLRYQVTGNDADRDLLYSLHGFQLHSNVLVTGLSPAPGAPSKVRITFQSFKTYAWDTYDWDYSEHLTVPNPDYGKTIERAIEPKAQSVVVYHRNAKRIEDAGLAAPYRFKTKPWSLLIAPLVSPADVDPSRTL